MVAGVFLSSIVVATVVPSGWCGGAGLLWAGCCWVSTCSSPTSAGFSLHLSTTHNTNLITLTKHQITTPHTNTKPITHTHTHIHTHTHTHSPITHTHTHSPTTRAHTFTNHTHLERIAARTHASSCRYVVSDTYAQLTRKLFFCHHPRKPLQQLTLNSCRHVQVLSRWCGVVGWGGVGCGVVWCGMVWCGVVWCDIFICIAFQSTLAILKTEPWLALLRGRQ